MQKFLIAAAVALLPSGAIAEDCMWYVREGGKDTWITDRGETLVERSPSLGNIALVYDVLPVEGRPNVKKARFVNSAGTETSFLFRFIEWNGERILIADMDMYFQTCEDPQAQKPPA
ncbi:hypothetical protein [Mesorhizobium sp. ANAO-SY3R2]|uniref:hypothetical protein n=1 Tax=Mesorhizobium sp. ANAO-SY3R2 TaxID=3166644 RepID=UPI00366B5564